VIMRGPVAYVFDGVLHGDLLALMRAGA